MVTIVVAGFQKCFISCNNVQLGTIHKVRTLTGGRRGSSQKRTFSIKSTFFPIQKAYRGGGGGLKNTVICAYLLYG